MVQINNDQRLKLVSHLIELQEQHKDNEDLRWSIEVLTKLNVGIVDVPQFFKDAFESRELYSHLKNEDLLFFFKNNVLLPIYHNGLGTAKHNELEDIIPGIRNGINEEIERINGLIADPSQQNYAEQEQQKLPFFELLKSMINPELVKDEKNDLSRSLNFNDVDQCLEVNNIPRTPSPSFYLNSPISPIHSPGYVNFSNIRLSTEGDVISFGSNESIASSLDSIEVLQCDCSNENLQCLFYKGV